VLSGEFIVANKYLMKDLIKLGLWDDQMMNRIKAENGSIQNITEIPANIRELYKTVWEISQKKIIDMSADRGAFICQSQSLNIHLTDANFGKMTSMHFYAWKKGLKTGMYYLRTKAATDAIKFTVTKEKAQQPQAAVVTAPGATVVPASIDPQSTSQQAIQCSLDAPDDCEMCGS
jgi:ribonucleoside-diphosphate reductase alpha chain